MGCLNAKLSFQSTAPQFQPTYICHINLYFESETFCGNRDESEYKTVPFHLIQFGIYLSSATFRFQYLSKSNFVMTRESVDLYYSNLIDKGVKIGDHERKIQCNCHTKTCSKVDKSQDNRCNKQVNRDS